MTKKTTKIKKDMAPLINQVSQHYWDMIEPGLKSIQSYQDQSSATQEALLAQNKIICACADEIEAQFSLMASQVKSQLEHLGQNVLYQYGTKKDSCVKTTCLDVAFNFCVTAVMLNIISRPQTPKDLHALWLCVPYYDKSQPLSKPICNAFVFTAISTITGISVDPFMVFYDIKNPNKYGDIYDKSNMFEVRKNGKANVSFLLASMPDLQSLRQQALYALSPKPYNNTAVATITFTIKALCDFLDFLLTKEMKDDTKISTLQTGSCLLDLTDHLIGIVEEKMPRILQDPSPDPLSFDCHGSDLCKDQGLWWFWVERIFIGLAQTRAKLLSWLPPQSVKINTHVRNAEQYLIFAQIFSSAPARRLWQDPSQRHPIFSSTIKALDLVQWLVYPPCFFQESNQECVGLFASFSKKIYDVRSKNAKIYMQDQSCYVNWLLLEMKRSVLHFDSYQELAALSDAKRKEVLLLGDSLVFVEATQGKMLQGKIDHLLPEFLEHVDDSKNKNIDIKTLLFVVEKSCEIFGDDKFISTLPVAFRAKFVYFLLPDRSPVMQKMTAFLPPSILLDILARQQRVKFKDFPAILAALDHQALHQELGQPPLDASQSGLLNPPSQPSKM